MSTVDLKTLLQQADQGGYAIPHFNFADLWDFLAIIEAAEEERAPVILAALPKVTGAYSPELVAAMGQVALAKSSIPVVLHLDHSTEVDLCIRCAELGFSSVMIDGSMLPLDDNIAAINRVIDFAHPRGIAVEGEIGRIMGRGVEGNFESGDFLARVEDAVELVRATGLDLLAVGIGTAHGFYTQKPKLNFQRLAEINRAIETPLVLHGGTGIPEEDVHQAIKAGINKVNVGTIIRYTYLEQLRHEVDSHPLDTHPIDFMLPVKEKVKAVVRQWIRVCLADGKA